MAVEETRTYQSTQKILDISSSGFISYTTNTEIPEKVRKTFELIIQEKEKVSTVEKELKSLRDRQSDTAKEQDRVRKNLESVGAETQQGRVFLAKLLKLESELETLQTDITAATSRVVKAQEDFTAFVKNITIE